MRLAGATLATLLLVAGSVRADASAPLERRARGVGTLGDGLPAPRPPLAQRLAAQLVRLRAEHARRSRDRALDRLREHGRLSYIGTPEELEHDLVRELATLRRDRDVEELELSRLATAPSGGARAELEAARHRLDLERSIDRVLEQVQLERDVHQLKGRLERKRAAELRMQRPDALRSEGWRPGPRSGGAPGLGLR